MSDSPEQTERVAVRRAPKYGVFIGLGAVLGLVAAVVVYRLTPVDTEFDATATIGFLGLILGGAGMALGAVLALLLDRSLAKRAGSALAERSSDRDETA